ncbi:MAG: PLP-dependent aminotransferase family protein [Gemmatimonadaceae bacterium]
MSQQRQSRTWRPHLSGRSGPLYRAIADAIEADTHSGVLAAGDSLPTQRELADSLGVNFTTITRAYAEARRRGLITARVGRGTFVAEPRLAREDQPEPGIRDYNLSVNQGPVRPWLTHALKQTLGRLSTDSSVVRNFLSYNSQDGGSPAARDAGVLWLERCGVPGTRDRLVIAQGAQHAVSMLLQVLARPGDTMLVEALSYPGFRSAAQLAGVRIVPVVMDDDGIDPEALEQACRRYSPRLLCCVPTLQNPTTAIMPLDRRHALINIARRYSLAVIEDDAYGPLALDPPPTLAALAPDLVTYVGSLSKCVAPGLRTAFLLTPTSADAERLQAAVRASVLMLSPIPIALASAWIRDGTAERALNDLRQEMTARGALARTVLAQYDLSLPSGSLHAWLRLPFSSSVAAFVARAHQCGVRVAPSDWYVMPPPGDVPTSASLAPSAVPAVRLALGAEQDRGRVAEALSRLASILGRPGSLQTSSL